MPRKKVRIRRKVVVGHDPGGKPVVKWAIGYTEKEVDRRKQELMQEYKTGVTPAQKDMLYRFFAQQWYDACKKSDLSASSKRSYANAFNNHIFPYISDKQIRAVSSLELQALINRLRGKSSTLIGDVYSVLKNTFGYAYAHGYIDRDPSYSLVRPTSNDGTRRSLTDSEASAVLNVGASHPDGLFLLLLYYTGMRRGELIGLRWGDVDFDAKEIHIRRDIDFVTNGVDSVKTPAALRTIPIPNPLLSSLRLVRGLPAAYVIQSRSGSFLNQSSYKRLWKRLMSSMLDSDPSIEWRVLQDTPAKPKKGNTPARSAVYIRGSILTPHYFRHNYASILYNAGVDVLTAQKILGHSDPTTTISIYAHLSSSHEKLDVGRIMSVFDAPLPSPESASVPNREKRLTES